MSPAQYCGNQFETSPVEYGAFAADPVGADLQDPVHLCFAGTGLPVPGPGSDIHVVVACVGVLVVVAAGEHQSQKVAAAMADQKDRAVFAPGVVFFVGHPGPYDLARVRGAVRLRGVPDRGSSAEIARIIGDRPRPAGGPRACC